MITTKNPLYRILSVALATFAFSLFVVACGDDSDDGGTCEAGQELVSLGGVQECASACDSGVCPTGKRCNSGYCVTAASSNNTNSTNNANSTNNGNNTNNTTNNNTNNTNNTTNNNTNNTNNTNNNNGCNPSGVAGVCDPLCQTGCGDNQTCVYGGNPAMAECQPVGTAVQGETCNSMTPCALGYGCIIASAMATSGTCQKYCRPGGGDPACGMGETCAQVATGVGVCATPEDTCEILPADTCADAAQMCVATTVGRQCVAFNANANVGDSCMNSSQCNDGQSCAGINGAPAVCLSICDPTNPMCPQGQQCGALTDANGVSLGYGVCATPM